MFFKRLQKIQQRNVVGTKYLIVKLWKQDVSSNYSQIININNRDCIRISEVSEYQKYLRVSDGPAQSSSPAAASEEPGTRRTCRRASAATSPWAGWACSRLGACWVNWAKWADWALWCLGVNWEGWCLWAGSWEQQAWWETWEESLASPRWPGWWSRLRKRRMEMKEELWGGVKVVRRWMKICKAGLKWKTFSLPPPPHIPLSLNPFSSTRPHLNMLIKFIQTDDISERGEEDFISSGGGEEDFLSSGGGEDDWVYSNGSNWQNNLHKSISVFWRTKHLKQNHLTAEKHNNRSKI